MLTHKFLGQTHGSDTYLDYCRMGRFAAARRAGRQRQQHRVPKQRVLRPRSVGRQRLRMQAHRVTVVCHQQATNLRLLPCMQAPGDRICRGMLNTLQLQKSGYSASASGFSLVCWHSAHP